MSESPDTSILSQSQGEKHSEIQTIVPMSRVKTIMKSSPEVSTINTETLYVVCKATVSRRSISTDSSHLFSLFVFKIKKGTIHSSSCKGDV